MRADTQIGEGLRQESDSGAIEVAGKGAKSDEGVHVGASLLQGRPGGSVEGPADPKLNRCGKGEKDKGLTQPRGRPWEQAGHGTDHDRETEQQADQEFGAQVADFCRPCQALQIRRVTSVNI